MTTNQMSEAREKARSILAGILGLQGKTTLEGSRRPADEEDFYLLGGTSLMASIATELLRENGFQVKLSLLMTTGNIGRVLDAIFQSNQLMTIKNGPPQSSGIRPLETTEIEEPDGIRIHEWKRDDTKTSRAIYEEAKQLVSLEFDRTEILGKAFGILKSDVEHTFQMFTVERSILLTATYQPTFKMPLYGWVPDQILGVVLALPKRDVLPMPDNPRSSKLQKFFDQIENVTYPEGVPIEDALTVMQVAVRAPDLDRSLPDVDHLMSRWSKLKVRMLLRLEEEILRIAEDRQFPVTEAINTSRATKEACLELGYETMKSLSLGEFEQQCNIPVDPCYHNNRVYYMIKRL